MREYPNILFIQISASMDGKPAVVDRGMFGVLVDTWSQHTGHVFTLDGKPVSFADAAAWLYRTNELKAALATRPRVTTDPVNDLFN